MAIQSNHKRLDDMLRNPDLADDLRDLIAAARQSAEHRGETLVTVGDLASYVERLLGSDPELLALALDA